MKSFFSCLILTFLGTAVSAQARVTVVPSGIFYGIIPCIHCEDIEIYLQLNANKTGVLQERYRGTEKTVSSTNITWEMKQNIVTLYDKSIQRNRFRYSGTKLILLGEKDKPVKDKNPQKGVLSRKKPMGMNDVWINKQQNGIEVIAMGNEPGWSLEMDFEKGYNFYSSGKDVITLPASKPVFENGGWSFNAKAGENVLVARIEPAFCGDGMSDGVYEYAAVVTFNGKTYKGVAVLLNTSFALEGDWELEYLNEPTIKMEWRQTPSLRFDLNQHRVGGTDGCNRIMGAFKLGENGLLAFSQMAGTMMACPGNNSASYFNAALAKVTRFRIVNGKLDLMDQSGILITMKKKL